EDRWRGSMTSMKKRAFKRKHSRRTRRAGPARTAAAVGPEIVSVSPLGAGTVERKIAWVYVDESETPQANAVSVSKHFSVGALTTESPIETSVIQRAMEALARDSEAAGDPALVRGYFHASF